MGQMDMYRGEKKTWQGAAVVNGSALDLTGAEVYFTVRENYPTSDITSDADASIAVSTTSTDIVVTDDAGGLFEITLSKSHSNTLEADKEYVYGIEVVLSGETDPIVLEQGIFYLKPDVARTV